MSNGMLIFVAVSAFTAGAIFCRCFSPLDRIWRDLKKHSEELTDKVCSATRDGHANDDRVADLARRVSSLERKLVGTNRRVDECWSRKRGTAK